MNPGGVYTVTAANEEGEDVAVIVLDIVGQSPQFLGSFNNLTLPHLTPHLIRGQSYTEMYNVTLRKNFL